MSNSLIAIAFILGFAGADAPSAGAGAVPPVPVPAGDPAARALAEGDRLEAAGEYEKAIAAYKAVLEGHGAEALWRISRAYSDMGEAAPEDRQKVLFDRAVEYGREAVKAAPGSSDAHALLAVALGRKALFSSPKEGVRISREVKAEADRAVALDKDKFLPYLVLGIWNREISGLGFFEKALAKILYGGVPDASLEASAKSLERAVSLEPGALKAHYELAVTYRELGEKEKARKELRQVVDRRAVRALDGPLQAKAREFLRKLGG